MAGKRWTAPVGSRSGPTTFRTSLGVLAGTGHTEPQADSCPRRSGAPINRNSGMMRDKRTVWGGPSLVWAALYMEALVATRYKPVI